MGCGYRVIQASGGCAVLRPHYDAMFATEAEAYLLLVECLRCYPNVGWAVERVEERRLRINAEYLHGVLRTDCMDELERFRRRQQEEHPANA